MGFAVRILEGNSPELYQAVGCFVLSPACLRENNNYPYKSSWKHSWHVLYQEERVVAFMPVERKTGGGHKIDNYYATSAKERNSPVAKAAVVAAVNNRASSPLRATVQQRDVGIFKYVNFILIRETKRYAMMELLSDPQDQSLLAC